MYGFDFFSQNFYPVFRIAIEHCITDIKIDSDEV